LLRKYERARRNDMAEIILERTVNMKLTKSILAASLAVMVFISCSAGAIAGCNRVTGDAGRWRDSSDPAGRIQDMCVRGINFYEAQAGKMIFQGRNGTDCGDLVAYAKGQESWHFDWFLWSEISCDSGMRMFIK
jgi:hypothetical protein